MASGCNKTHPYLLNEQCVSQCNEMLSIINSTGNCLLQCIGQGSATQVDENGNKYKVCTKCESDKPFFNNVTSACVDQCPTTNIANSDLVCLQSCDNGHLRNEQVNTSNGTFDYRLCVICPSAYPFYNITSQTCTSDCNQNKDIYVTETNECTTQDNCPVKVLSSMNNIQYVQCYNCSTQEPFIENGKCVTKCTNNQINLVDESNVCIKMCQGTTSEKIIGGQNATLCEKCPPTAPFWNGIACVSQCNQTYKGLSTVSQDNVCQQYTTGYLNKIDVYSIPYYEITSYCTTNKTDDSGQVCLSCAEINPSKPFLNGLICDNKCDFQINGQNLVSPQKRCLSYIQTSINVFLPRVLTTDFTTQYYVKVQQCPSKSKQIVNGIDQCIPCINSNTVEDSGMCRVYAQNELIDINNIVISNCPSNYNQLTFKNYTYCLPNRTYYTANRLGSVDNCDIQNVLYYGTNIAYCLMNITQTNALRVQTSNNMSQYFIYEEQTSSQSSCPQGYKQVVNNCIKVASCVEYSMFCNNSICSSYSYDTNNVCENRCLGASIYDSNKKCTPCTTGQVVENNTCVANCSNTQPLLEDQKCVSECTILRINNLPVLNSTNQSICLIECNTYMYQQDSQSYYTCTNSCAASADKKFYQVYNYNYNQFTKDANVCVANCQSNQGKYQRENETQCMVCHQNQLVNQNGTCVQKCLQEGTTVYYDVDGYCQLTCNGYVFNGEKCYTSCKQNNMVVTSNMQNCSLQCNQGQSISTSILPEEYVCVDSCPNFSQNGYCVNSCNASYPFVFNNSVCSANCNGAAVIVVNQRKQCLNQCNYITVPKQYDYINYYICTPSCYSLNMVHFNQQCHDNCYIAQQTQNTTEKPLLYKYNGQCLDQCPTESYYINQVSQENVCTGLSKSQKMGIGIGVSIAVVLIIIILVPVILIILKKKNIIKFKYPLPKSGQQTASRRYNNPINLQAIQQSLDNDALVNYVQKTDDTGKRNTAHTFT